MDKEEDTSDEGGRRGRTIAMTGMVIGLVA